MAQFDFDKVTPRMLVDFKEKTGTSLMALTAGGKQELDLASMDETTVAAFIWIALRMSGRPDATWDEALDTPFSELDLDVDEDPTNASNES